MSARSEAIEKAARRVTEWTEAGCDPSRRAIEDLRAALARPVDEPAAWPDAQSQKFRDDIRRSFPSLPPDAPALEKFEGDPEARRAVNDVPFPLCVGHTREENVHKSLRPMWEVPIHVGRPENRGNCVAHVYLGGRGGINGEREAVENFAAWLVTATNEHPTLAAENVSLKARIEVLEAAQKRVEFLEARLGAVTKWLEDNQPDVFSRGIWDAVNAASSALRAAS